MSAYVLLNVLNKLRKEIKCEACRAFCLFFATRFYLSYDLKIILKSYFWREKL